MMNIDKKCQGCGALLQTNNPDQPGYTPTLEHVICQSCYQLKHYGVATTHIHPNQLPKLEDNALVLMVSSVLHLDMLFEYPIYRYQENAIFVYIINQMDLLPKSTNASFLLNQIIRKAQKRRIPYQDIVLMSAKNATDLKHLREYIQKTNKKSIYLIGVQNSGKTTLFKYLTHNSEALAMKKAALTQSPLTGMIDHQTIIDMPGLYQKGYLHTFLPYDTYKRLLPDHEMKPRIFQVSEQAFLIENWIIVSYSGQAKSVIFYASDELKLRRINQEKAWDHSLDETFSYETQSYRLPKGKMQLTLSDFGFIHVEGEGHVKIKYPKGMHVTLTEALFR